MDTKTSEQSPDTSDTKQKECNNHVKDKTCDTDHNITLIDFKFKEEI